MAEKYSWLLCDTTDNNRFIFGHKAITKPMFGNNKSKTDTNDELEYFDYRINSGTEETPIYERQELPFDQYAGNTYYWDSENEYFTDSEGNEVIAEEETEETEDE